MSWIALNLLACSSIWLSPASILPAACQGPPPIIANAGGRSPAGARSHRLYQLARSITVKVIAGHNGGSGILIRRQGQVYTIVTNRHVVTAGAPYKIQTPSGRSHAATWLKTIDFRGNDLALLQFRSRETYAIATLSPPTSVATGEPVLSAGFPLEPPPGIPKGFLATAGTISLIPEQPLLGGYQLGYTNSVYQGMSGGPVLNQQGVVVGVNSLHAYPLWGDPYVFQDGSYPLPQERSVIAQSSWAIPINTLLCLSTLPKTAVAKTVQNPISCAAKRSL